MSVIIVENGIENIKKKMTEIRRLRRNTVLHNYYNNCDEVNCIWTVYGDETVVFWNDDNGVMRVYFYSSDYEELKKLLIYSPVDACLEFLTKDLCEIEDIVSVAGFELKYTMNRYTMVKLDEERKKALQEYWDSIREALFVPGLARKAEASDAEEVYNKLYDVFDPSESHLCSMKELIEYIEEGWVTVAYSNEGILKGLQMFLVLPGYCKYGYQIWSDDDPEILCNLQLESNKQFKEYIELKEKEKGIHIEPRPSYAWVNVDNVKAIKNLKNGGATFDGLFDYGFKKVSKECI